MNKGLLVAVSLLALLLLSDSCRWQRRAARKRSAREVTLRDTIAVNERNMTPLHPNSSNFEISPAIRAEINRLMPLASKNIEWRTFDGKAKMHYEAKGENQDFTAFFRMEKDKKIWVNVTAAGGLVAVARALITPDSIQARIDLNKKAYVLPFTEASKLLPVAIDFKTLQDLIIGNVFSNAGGKPSKAYNAEVLGLDMALYFANEDFLQQVVYHVEDSLMVLQKLDPQQPNGPALKLTYSNYQRLQNKMFSNNRTVNIENKGQKVLLEMSFNRAKFDEALDFSFSIPAKYELQK